jgi:hypothetical protein
MSALRDAMVKHKKRKTAKARTKVEKVMGEYKRGTLHSGSKSGPTVTSRRQALAIALSQARRGS